MNRYFLATAMLALGAGGVVWIAIKERAATKPARTAPTAVATATATATTTATAIAATATAETPVSASATPTIDADVADAGEPVASIDASIPDGGQTFPPLAAYAAWSVVRWGTTVAEVESALKQAGVVVVDATDKKNEAKRVRAKSGSWDVTIDFGASGANQIVVTATNLSKEAAQAAISHAKDRAAATSTVVHNERHWKKDGDASTAFTSHVDGATASMHEEHVRERSPGGAIGFAGLRWGMSTQEVVGLLTAHGYAASAVKGSPTLPFSKGDVEGTASFNQFGLRHVEISGPTTDAGVARAKELEASLGKPTTSELSTKTQHLDHGRMTSIDVEVTEKQPGSGLTVTETYRPKN